MAGKIMEADYESVNTSNPLNLISKSFDGHMSLDLISIFENKDLDIKEEKFIVERLKVIEKDILNTFPKAHPKIAYLLNRWEVRKLAR